VLGKTFTRRALAELSGLGDADLEPPLRGLVRKEILSVQADPRSPEHGQYSFVQDLLRHVAYETLSKGERRTRHLAAAAHLQSTFPDEEEVVEVVASHYLDAYRTAPEAADAAEIKVKAREMLARAGERAGMGNLEGPDRPVPRLPDHVQGQCRAPRGAGEGGCRRGRGQREGTLP